jgi:hypothetical protein
VKHESNNEKIVPNNASRFLVEVCTFGDTAITPFALYISNNRGFSHEIFSNTERSALSVD